MSFADPPWYLPIFLTPYVNILRSDAEYYVKTLVKEGVSIGANATIICGNTLGAHCLIGAGTVVTKNIPDYALVVGNPGRIVGWVSEAGKKINF